MIKLRLSPVRDTSEDQTAHAFPRSITPFSSLPRSSWRHDAIPLPGVGCNAVNRGRWCEGGSGRRIHKLGRRQRRTRNTIEKWWGTVQEGKGVSLARTVPGHGPSLSPPKDTRDCVYVQLQVSACSCWMGFQPRLLGNRSVTSRTDVTTVHHCTRYPGPIVDPRIGLCSPSTSGVYSYWDVDFGNRPPRSCRNDNAE